MAKSITITRDLTKQGGDINAPLISAFIQNSIEFEFDRESLIDSYATIQIDTYEFKATKIKTVGTVDTYVIDLTNILPYLLGFAPDKWVVSGLTKTINITIIGYNSSGISQATATHQPVELCFGYTDIGEMGGVESVYDNGAVYKSYITSWLCFYWKGTAGNYDLYIGNVLDAQTFSLAHGYNLIPISGTLKKTGTLRINGYTNRIDVVQLNDQINTNDIIRWINKDGRWSEMNMRFISTETTTKKTNEIPLWAIRNYELTAKSKMISTEKNNKLFFDCVAYDTEHYRQLTEIAESPTILYNNRIYNVSDISKSVSEYRQNLHFKITLEIEENAVTY